MWVEWVLLLPLLVLATTHLVAVVGFAVQAADRNTPVRIDAQTLSLIAREGGARAFLWAIGFFAFGRPSPRAANAAVGDPRIPPILLVPGRTWNRSSLWPLATFLTNRGHRWVHAVDRADPHGTLASEAEALKLRIAELKAASGSSQVDLVAFSTGGLVAAWYLRHHDASSVRRLVTIGTAWRGTRMAVFGSGRSVDEVRFGSHVLDGLWPPPTPTVCIWSPDDPVVVPATSALPEHGADAVQVDAGGHADLLLSARVFRAVQAALAQPLPDPLPERLTDEVALPSPTIVPAVVEAT